MPCNVAMKRPNPRIIGNEIEYNIALPASQITRIPHIEKLSIPPLWILGSCHSSIPGTSSLSHNPEVMTVEMHGVREWVDGVDY